MDLPEPLSQIVKDQHELALSIKKDREDLDEINRRIDQKSEDIEALKAAENYYRRSHGLPSSRESDTSSSQTHELDTSQREDEDVDFGAASEEKRASLLSEYFESVRCFKKIGQISEDLELKYPNVTRHNLRTIIQKMYDRDEIVMIRYGNSRRYVAYGLREFIEVVEDGSVTVVDPSVWPEMHSNMSNAPSFSWGSKEQSETEDEKTHANGTLRSREEGEQSPNRHAIVKSDYTMLIQKRGDHS